MGYPLGPILSGNANSVVWEVGGNQRFRNFFVGKGFDSLLVHFLDIKCGSGICIHCRQVLRVHIDCDKLVTLIRLEPITVPEPVVMMSVVVMSVMTPVVMMMMVSLLSKRTSAKKATFTI